jgi:hypothetical protein
MPKNKLGVKKQNKEQEQEQNKSQYRIKRERSCIFLFFTLNEMTNAIQQFSHTGTGNAKDYSVLPNVFFSD